MKATIISYIFHPKPPPNNDSLIERSNFALVSALVVGNEDVHHLLVLLLPSINHDSSHLFVLDENETILKPFFLFS